MCDVFDSSRTITDQAKLYLGPSEYSGVAFAYLGMWKEPQVFIIHTARALVVEQCWPALASSMFFNSHEIYFLEFDNIRLPCN